MLAPSFTWIWVPCRSVMLMASFGAFSAWTSRYSVAWPRLVTMGPGPAGCQGASATWPPWRWWRISAHRMRVADVLPAVRTGAVATVLGLRLNEPARSPTGLGLEHGCRCGQHEGAVPVLAFVNVRKTQPLVSTRAVVWIGRSAVALPSNASRRTSASAMAANPVQVSVSVMGRVLVYGWDAANGCSAHLRTSRTKRSIRMGSFQLSERPARNRIDGLSR